MKTQVIEVVTLPSSESTWRCRQHGPL